jgi:hypothetical protein
VRFIEEDDGLDRHLALHQADDGHTAHWPPLANAHMRGGCVVAAFSTLGSLGSCAPTASPAGASVRVWLQHRSQEPFLFTTNKNGLLG